MAKPNIVGWFDRKWMSVRERAAHEGWETLSRPDQVLTAVGFMLDSCVGDGVWAIVDGVIEGSDEGLTLRMPEALEEVGLYRAAENIRQIIRVRTQSGSTEKDEAGREKAIEYWWVIERLFNEWEPGGERVMLARLYRWYKAQSRKLG